MVRYNIFDLLSPKSKEKLDSIVAKREIIVDENLLQQLNLSRASIKANGAAGFQNAPVRYELRRSVETSSKTNPGEPVDEQEIIEENFKVLKFYTKLRKAFDDLYEEEMAIIAHREKMIEEMELELQLMLQKEAEERRMNNDTAVSHIHGQYRERLLKLLTEINSAKLDLLNQLKDLKELKKELTANLEKIKILQKETLEFDAKNISTQLTSFVSPEGKNYFEGKTQEQKDGFSKDLILEVLRLDTEIETDENRLTEINHLTTDLHSQKNAIIANLSKIGQDHTDQPSMTLLHGMQRAGMHDHEVHKIDAKLAELANETVIINKNLPAKKDRRDNLEHVVLELAKKHDLHELAGASDVERRAVADHVKPFLQEAAEHQKELENVKKATELKLSVIDETVKQISAKTEQLNKTEDTQAKMIKVSSSQVDERLEEELKAYENSSLEVTSELGDMLAGMMDDIGLDEQHPNPKI